MKNKEMENLIKDFEELLMFAKIGKLELYNRELLKHFNLSIGDIIELQEVKDIGPMKYSFEKGKIYVVLGILNNNIYVKGINNDHCGYLHFECIIKYKLLKYTDLK